MVQVTLRTGFSLLDDNPASLGPHADLRVGAPDRRVLSAVTLGHPKMSVAPLVDSSHLLIDTGLSISRKQLPMTRSGHPDALDLLHVPPADFKSDVPYTYCIVGTSRGLADRGVDPVRLWWL